MGITEERSAAQNHPNIVQPYFSHALSQTAASRNLGIQSSSASTTTSLISTANHITQWAGSALSTLMEDELLREQRKREELNRRHEAQVENQAQQAVLEAEKVERLEKKREAAREGWKKRRVNAEEKHVNDLERRKNASEAAIMKRAERRAAIEEQKKLRLEEHACLVEERKAMGMPLDDLILGPEEDLMFDELDNDDEFDEFEFDEEQDSKGFGGDANFQSPNGVDESRLNPVFLGTDNSGDGHRHLFPSAALATSRKRAASASSSAEASSATLSKRARLSPSATMTSVKPEIIDSVLPPSFRPSHTEYQPSSSSNMSPAPSHNHNGLIAHISPHPLSSPAGLQHQQEYQDHQPQAQVSQISLAGSDDGSPALFPRSGSQRAQMNRIRGSQMESERKVWSTLARSNIPKVIRVQQQGLVSRQIFHKRLSGAVAREAKKYNTKHPKPPKDIQVRARRVMREMLLHLKSGEKNQRETKRKADKEQLDKAKREEEIREASRAARKLNFLITQTELYSHFVGSKLKSTYCQNNVSVVLLLMEVVLGLSSI